MRETLESYCRRMDLIAVLEQWDREANFPLTPGGISRGSRQKVWWRCSEGHIWQAAVYTRAEGAGCPVCAGKVVQAGSTDLGTLYPDLARQWHPVLNGTLTPEQVLPGSHRSVWWICEKGHEWRAQVRSRAAGCGCPVCAGREIRPDENSLAARYPAVAAQWHPTRNGNLTADAVAPGSPRKVWWLCDRGHEWQASVAARVSGGSGCPVCAGKRVVPGENDLASRFPGIAAQWHPTKNGNLTPRQVVSHSNRKVWWRCSLGHDYKAAVGDRTAGRGCPYCAGRKVLPGFNDLASQAPETAAQWHPALNGPLTPEMVTAGSHRKVWWQCAEGHVWKAAVYSRAGPQRCGCPVCAGRVSARKLARLPV